MAILFLVRRDQASWHVFFVSAACLVLSVSPSELEDKSPHCATWAAMGECTKNAVYMLKDCSLSCYAPVQRQPAVEEPAPLAQNDAHEFHAVGDSLAGDSIVVGTSSTDSHCDASGQSCTGIEGSHSDLAPEGTNSSSDLDEYAVASSNHTLSLDVSQLREMIMKIKTDADNRITAARMDSFDELIASHAKDIADELKAQERKYKEMLERAKREARKTELLLRHQLREAEERAAKAEEKLRRIEVGDETKAAIARASTLALALQAEEQQRLAMEKQFQEALTQSQAREDAALLREKACEEREHAAATIAERTDKKNEFLRKTRRRLLMTKRQNFDRACDTQKHTHSRSGQDATGWKTRDNTSGEQFSNVTSGGKQTHDLVRASVVEALQIIYPLRDLSIFRMHSELCLALTCSSSHALNFIALVVAFAWIALWRFVWVYSLRYVMGGFGKLLGGTLHLWDVFSDWFLGIDKLDRGRTRDF